MAHTEKYDFDFVYTDGSSYTGTVAAKPGHYFASESFADGLGTYYITSRVGQTHEAPGTVITSSYYDTTSSKYYTPAYGTDGSNYLGSESDYIYGAEGWQQFGWSGSSDHEAKEGNILYGYLFVYNDDSYYGGKVSSNSTTYNYYVGEEINTFYGKYYIEGNDGYTSEPSGTVTTTGDFWYNPGSAYHPVINQSSPDGNSGLGSELNAWQASPTFAYGFGLGGRYEV